MAVLLLLPAGAHAAAPGERYANPKYRLSLTLPPGVEACRSTPPAPSHGILFRPRGVTSPPCDGDIEAGSRYTAIDAHFDVDGATTAANFAATLCPQFAYDSQGKVSAIRPPAVPGGGLTWVACRIDGAGGSIEEIAFARREAIAGGPATDYTVTLKTTPPAYSTDHAAFADWLRTIRVPGPLGARARRPMPSPACRAMPPARC